MGNSVDQNDNGTPAEFRNAAVFGVGPITCFGSNEEYYAITEKLYADARADFMNTDAGSDELVKRAAEWEKISRGMIMANAELFGRKKGSQENRDKALKGLNACKKDAGIRVKNLDRHYELAKQNEKTDPEHLRKLRLNLNKCLMFLYRAVNTQRKYLQLYVSSPDYMTPELAIEKRASARVAKGMKMIPEGHYFLPARPFPPYRVPEGEPVPYPPAAYAAWKNIPKEEFYFDTEHDEFALPKGYISKDQRIDDESVVWDWENRTVTMKFRGEEPVTWPFWKPKDTSDVLKDGDWCAEYYIRLYQQFLDDAEPPGLNEV